MRINIGQVFADNDPIIAIEIPGFGVLRSEQKKDEFAYVELTKKQLYKLSKAIEKELADEKTAHV